MGLILAMSGSWARGPRAQKRLMHGWAFEPRLYLHGEKTRIRLTLNPRETRAYRDTHREENGDRYRRGDREEETKCDRMHTFGLIICSFFLSTIEPKAGASLPLLLIVYFLTYAVAGGWGGTEGKGAERNRGSWSRDGGKPATLSAARGGEQKHHGNKERREEG